MAAADLARALAGEDLERWRPLLPVGYDAVAEAYRAAAADVTAASLSRHYTDGLGFFRDTLAPHVIRRVGALVGGAWNLGDHVAYAAGSDVDFMTHVVEAIAGAGEDVALYPGGWWGFRVGATHDDRVRFTEDARGALACLCVPSVRNGQLDGDMVAWLEDAGACLLNVNLLPTMAADERAAVGRALAGAVDRSILSISFSRGFGLTASQLGVVLVHRDHPYRARFERQWSWLTYFYNHIAARAFTLVDFDRLQEVDDARRRWVAGWLDARGLPRVDTGSYYVKSFRVDGPIPAQLRPLVRDEPGRPPIVRLCFKPPQT